MTETAPKRVSSWQIAAFAAPAAPLLALTLPTIIFLPHHFSTHLGLPLGVVSIVFFAARALDIVLDPLFGGLQDRTHTRSGRRRIWLVGASPLLILLVAYVFLGLREGESAYVAGAALMALYAAYAAMMIAHLGWAGELIPTYRGRTRVLGAVQLASMIGQTGMLLLAAIVVQGLGGTDADAVTSMGWTMLVLLPLTTLVAVNFAPEPRTPPQPHLGFKVAVRTLIENPLVRRVLAPDLLLGIAQGVSGTLFLFYFQFVLGFANQSQTLLAIYFIAGLAGVPIWWIAGQRIGKHRALQVVFLYTAATTALIGFLPANAFGLAIVIMILAGLAQGGGVLLTRSLMADVVDSDELNTGARRSGLYFGILLTTSKIGLATGPLFLMALGWAGLDPEPGATQTAAALDMLRICFLGAPITLCLAAAATLRNYPLDEKRQAELAAAIAARAAEASAKEG